MLTHIAKDFRWEMAHRLPEHDGGCRNVHGHSYCMWIELSGEPQSAGMVLDYFDLKRMVDPMVAELDHAFLCTRSDVLISDFLRGSGLKAVYVDWPTTAENIARWFFERLSLTFASMKHLRELRVRIQETERTYAEVSGPL
ncbi:MAG: 6-carboxytetrahydropterin synthase [Bacteroidota bacterium]|nr:6-carboxytetrahydropterin synthase [Bacteroidota bacterium]MDP4234221.1 6-carboxytetrahydropterin synthase [Bacteroidota bacterium]MDP4243411.1 6-carboxytetrahydropterin synthase [Bacteroidota bacterium]MDP4288110.1 6-carboxytetrahydropterin synthase [Bacteroidota bacterium]